MLPAEDNCDIVAFLAQWQSPLKLKAIKTAESHATILVFEVSAERYGVRHYYRMGITPESILIRDVEIESSDELLRDDWRSRNILPRLYRRGRSISRRI